MSVTRAIILINIAISAIWITANESRLAFMEANFLVSWTALLEGRVWVLVTSVFSHLMLFHLFINMFVLNSFGGLLEQVLGRISYFRFYIIAGIISSLAHALVSAFILGEPSLPALGASGSVAGLILIFALLFPRARILLFGFIPMPALWGALAFVGLDIWGLMAQFKGGGLPIGHGAHLGGSLTGAIYYFFFLRPRIRELRQLSVTA